MRASEASYEVSPSVCPMQTYQMTGSCSVCNYKKPREEIQVALSELIALAGMGQWNILVY